MFALGGVEGLLVLLVPLLLWAVGLFVLYWVIRLAVRHAMADARRGGAAPPRGGPPTSP